MTAVFPSPLRGITGDVTFVRAIYENGITYDAIAKAWNGSNRTMRNIPQHSPYERSRTRLLDRASTPMPLEKGEAMRSRTNQINVWLSDEELAGLNEKGPKIRSSCERFIRQCINSAAIREATFVDVEADLRSPQGGGQSQPHPHRRQRQRSAGIRQNSARHWSGTGSGSTHRRRLHEGLTTKANRTASRSCIAYIGYDIVRSM